MDALPTDVERALQLAIGQANSAFATGVPSIDIGPQHTQHKKGKKRAREDTAGEDQQPKDKRQKKDATEEGGQPKEKKRKRKQHEHVDKSSPAHDSNIDPTLLNEITVPDVEKKKKSKKKKHADVASSEVPSASTLPSVDPMTGLSALDPFSSASPAQTAAFISALTATAGDHGAPPAVHDPYYAQPSPAFPNFNPGDDTLLSLNTNDDILRAFQDLDLTRLAGVLRSLDLPTSPSQSNAHLNDLLHGDLDTASLGQEFATASVAKRSSAASSTSAQPRKAQPSTAAKRTKKPSKPAPIENPNLASIGPSVANDQHTQILATKWLNAAKLKEMVETEGLVYKKGKFSAMEEQALKAAIENYRVSHGLLADQLTQVIFAKAKEENGSFWSEITTSVPARPIIAVYHHVRRAYHPLKLQGKWAKEEDSALIQAVADLGQAWQKVSERVGRTAQDCRDRWRNHLAHRAERQKGHWTKEEEAELTRIVAELTTDRGKDSDNDVFWGIVSDRMGNKRGRQQCRIKWTDSLSKTVKNAGQTPRWNKQDAYILVHKVASLDVRDDSEIDWKILADPDWNLWSPHSLQRRWRSLKHSIKGHETMAFREIVEILKQKNANPPPRMDQASPGKKKGLKAKIVSSLVIEEEGDGDQARERKENDDESESEEDNKESEDEQA